MQLLADGGQHAERLPYTRKFPAVPLAALSDGELRLFAQRYKFRPGWDEGTHSLTDREGVLAQLIAKQEELRAKEADEKKKVTVGATPKGEQNPMTQSTRDRDDVDLSGREDRAHGTEADVLPFLEGMVANMVDGNHQWIAQANELEMPLRAGISGTTNRFMNLARLLGSDLVGARFAMLGHLIPTNAHSFHEIMVAAELPYDQGKYVPMDPLGASEMRSIAATAGTPADQIDAVLGIKQ